MGARFFLTAVAISLSFTGAFLVSDWAREGTLRSEFLFRHVAPTLGRVSSTMSDLKLKFRGPKAIKNRVVIVAIDEPSLKTLGRWPWPRDYMALLLKGILEQEPKVVGLDILFSEAEQRIPEELEHELKKRGLTSLIPAESYGLVDVTKQYASRLVFAWSTEYGCLPNFPDRNGCPVELAEAPPWFENFSIGSRTIEPGFSLLRTSLWSTPRVNDNIPQISGEARHTGFVNTLEDLDGTVRQALLVGLVGGVPYPSLPLAMARAGLKDQLSVKLDAQGGLVDLSWRKRASQIRVNQRGLAQIDFRGTSDVFPMVSAIDLIEESERLKDPENRRLASVSKAEILKDAYVLVGVTALAIHDYRPTPFDSSSPGVAIHAAILDNLLSGDLLSTGREGGGFWIVLILMTFGVLGMARIAARLEAIPAQLLFAGFLAALAYCDFDVLFLHNRDWNTGFLYIETAVLMLVMVMARYVIEERKKKFIRGAFAKYLAPAVVDEIVHDPSSLVLGGRRQPLTILFSDIRGFTTFSERMDAKLLSEFLNDYLSVMTRIVFENRGTLDKYIGDAVMAFWGAPLENGAHAADCCETAIRMQRALTEHRPRFKEKYGVDVAIGVGVNTGEVSVGNMGSELSFSYTVIGDSVNLASRLEGATKAYGIAILATQATIEAIRATGRELPPFRTLDLVRVKGKKKAVEIVEILHEQLPGEALEFFEKGRALYAARAWSEAVTAFEQADRLVAAATGNPDGPSRVYLARCETLRENDPGVDWDGSWEFDSK